MTTQFHPIMFTAESIRSILAGQKTMTRRVVNPQPNDMKPLGPYGRMIPYRFGKEVPDIPGVRVQEPIKCPYGKPGDILWVKESLYFSVENNNLYYSADDKGVGDDIFRKFYRRGSIRPRVGALLMPRWASRINLEILRLDVARVQDISEADAKAEGADPHFDPAGFSEWPDAPGFIKHDLGGVEVMRVAIARRFGFQQQWDAINAKRGFAWDTNPYVWIIEFRIVDHA